MASRDAGAWALPPARGGALAPQGAEWLAGRAPSAAPRELAQRLFPTPAATPAGTPASVRPAGGMGGASRQMSAEASARWAALDAEEARLDARGRQLAAVLAQHSAAFAARAPGAAPPPARAWGAKGAAELPRRSEVPAAPATAPARGARPARADELLTWALEAEAEGAAADVAASASLAPASPSAFAPCAAPPPAAAERPKPQSAPPAPRPAARASAPAHGPEPGRAAGSAPAFAQSPPLRPPPPRRPSLDAPPPRDSPRHEPAAEPRWSAPRASVASSAEVLPLPSDEDTSSDDGAAAASTPHRSARSSHVSWAEPPAVSRISTASTSVADEPPSARSSAAGGQGGGILEVWGAEDDDDDVAEGVATTSPLGPSSAEPTWDFPAVASPPPQPRMEASRRSASGSLPAASGVLAAAWRAANGETDATAPTPPPRDAASWQALQAARASIDRARSISPPVGDDVAVREEWSRPRSTRMAEFADGFVPEPAAEPVDDAPPLLLPHAQPPSPLGPHGSAALQGGIPGGVHLAVARISERRPDPKTIGLQPPQAQQQAPASPTAPRSSAAPAVATPQSAARSIAEAEDSGVPADVAACFAAFHAAGDGADALRLRAAGSDAGFVYSAFGFLVSAEDTLTKVAVALHAQRGWSARAHTALDADEEEIDDDDDDDDASKKTPAHNKLLWQLPLERLEAAWWSLDAEDDELMLLDAAGSGGDARLLLPARDVAVGALASLVARRGAALAAADTSDDPRKPWLGDRGPGGRQLLLLPPSDGDDDGKEDEEDTQPAASPLSPASPKVAAAPAEESGSDEASTSDDGSSDDAGPRRREWSGSGLRRSGS